MVILPCLFVNFCWSWIALCSFGRTTSECCVYRWATSFRYKRDVRTCMYHLDTSGNSRGTPGTV